jgi:hypothetical protein
LGALSQAGRIRRPEAMAMRCRRGRMEARWAY